MKTTVLAVTMIALLGLMGALDQGAAEDDARLYCEMVEANRKNVSDGWPDFKGIYATVCRNP